MAINVNLKNTKLLTSDEVGFSLLVNLPSCRGEDIFLTSPKTKTTKTFKFSACLTRTHSKVLEYREEGTLNLLSVIAER